MPTCTNCTPALKRWLGELLGASFDAARMAPVYKPASVPLVQGAEWVSPEEAAACPSWETPPSYPAAIVQERAFILQYGVDGYYYARYPLPSPNQASTIWVFVKVMGQVTIGRCNYQLPPRPREGAGTMLMLGSGPSVPEAKQQVGVGQCFPGTPPGLPQAICDYVQAQYQALPPATTQGWDPGNLLGTLQSWWQSQRGTPANPAPSLPFDLPTFTTQVLPLLNSAIQWWQQVGSKAPGPASTLPPSSWLPPLQYMPPGAQDIQTAVQGMLLNLLKDPAGLQAILTGVLPKFDPRSIDWSIIPNAQQWIQNVQTLGTFEFQKLQLFVTKLRACPGFVQGAPSAEYIVRAFADWETNPSSDPCAFRPAPSPTPGPGPQPQPTPSPTPGPIVPAPKPADKGIEWGTVAIGVGVIAAIGTGLYFALRQPAPKSNPLPAAAPAAALEAKPNPKRIRLARFLEETQVTLEENYGLSGTHARRALSSPAGNGRNVGFELYHRGMEPAAAAKSVHAVYERVMVAHSRQVGRARRRR